MTGRRFVVDARTAVPHFPGIGRVVTGTVGAMPDLLTDAEGLVVLTAPHGWRPESHPRIEPVEVALSPTGLSQQRVIPVLLDRLGATLYHSPFLVMPYRPRIPTVVTIHDLIPLHDHGHHRVRQRAVFSLALRLAVRSADRLVAVSAATARELTVDRAVDPQRVRVVRSGVGAPFRPRPPDEVATVLQRLGVRTPYLLYVGSNKPHKGLRVLVDAVARLRHRELRLVVAGMWDDRYPLDSGDIDGRIHLAGWVEDAELAALFAGSVAAVVPSLDEGFGLPALEALSCGAPLVASDLPCLREVAGEAAEWVPPGNAEALAAAIDGLHADPRSADTLRAAGLRRARCFPWGETARRMLNVYRELADQPGCRRR